MIPSLKIVLLDDSADEHNRAIIRKLCTDHQVAYHGSGEQSKLLNLLPCKHLWTFLSPLGMGRWSLGYNRNYALVYATALGAEQIVFMDDDVIINEDVLLKVFSTLTTDPFAGVEITVMPDDSVLGHIYRAGRQLLPQFVSGTFLGIDLRAVRHYHLNIYNEDWIWLFLQTDGRIIKKVAEVEQLMFDPFENWELRAAFQEFGEIVWDGLLHSAPDDRYACLVETQYWNEVFRIRKGEIHGIMPLPLPDNFKMLAEQISQYLLRMHDHFSPMQMAKLFRSYFSRLSDWRNLLTVAERQSLEFAQ